VQSVCLWAGLLGAILLIGPSLPLFADDFIVLKTGGALSGTIVKEDDRTIVIETDSGQKVISRRLVRAIVRSKRPEKEIRKAEDPDWGYEFDIPEGWSKKISSSGATILQRSGVRISVSARFDFFPIFESMDRLEEKFLQGERAKVVREKRLLVDGWKAYRIDIRSESIEPGEPCRLYRIILVDVFPIRYLIELAASEEEFETGEFALKEVLRSFRINKTRPGVELLRQKIAARLELIRARKMHLPAGLSHLIEDFEAGFVNSLSDLMSLDLSLDTFIKRNR